MDDCKLYNITEQPCYVVAGEMILQVFFILINLSEKLLLHHVFCNDSVNDILPGLAQEYLHVDGT